LEGGLDLGGGSASDAEKLAAGGGSGDQGDARLGKAKGVGEEGDEGLVGAAVHRWSGEDDLQSVGMEAGDGVTSGSGLNADGEGAAVRRGEKAG
jgi:hypothetical protein